MNDLPWAESVDVAMTVCDREGIVLYMNDRAAASFASGGGKTLVGTSLMPCHPEPARRRIQEILATRQANTYTIEKNGVRKLIHQAPWFGNGELGGLVEFSIVLPADLPHFIRS